METSNTLTLDGKKLRQLREEQRLTQLYLATAVEVTTETISRWENKPAPSIKLENAQRLAEVLQVPLTALLPEEKSSMPAPETEAVENSPLFARRPSLRLVSAVFALFLFTLFFLSWYFHSEAVLPRAQAQRYLPDHSLPGQPFPVLLQMQTETGSNSLMLREDLPAGIILLAATPPSVNTSEYSSTARQLKWISPAGGPSRQDFVYLVQTAPYAGDRQYSFSGTLVSAKRGGRPRVIAGATTVRINHCHWADENCDQSIDDYEMLSVFDLIPNAEEAGLDVASIKAIWAGQGYMWHQAESRLEILSRRDAGQEKSADLSR